MKKLLHMFDKELSSKEIIDLLRSKVRERDHLKAEEDIMFRERCSLQEEINKLIEKLIRPERVEKINKAISKEEV